MSRDYSKEFAGELKRELDETPGLDFIYRNNQPSDGYTLYGHINDGTIEVDFHDGDFRKYPGLKGAASDVELLNETAKVFREFFSPIALSEISLGHDNSQVALSADFLEEDNPRAVALSSKRGEDQEARELGNHLVRMGQEYMQERKKAYD